MNTVTAKIGETETSVSFRVNVVANGFGFSHTIPQFDYQGTDRTADIFKAADMFKKKGFEVFVVRIEQTFEKVK